MLYNVQLDDKCENELMGLCWNIDHLFLDQEDLRLEIWRNISIHISSVVIHDLTVGTHTLLPFPYQVIWSEYDAHVASLYFYMFHVCYFIFLQTFCFEHFGFDP